MFIGLWSVAVAGFIGALWLNEAQTRAAAEWAREADAVERAILDEDWPAAAEGLSRLRTSWEHTRSKWALHREHEEMDEVTDALTEAAAHIRMQDQAALVALRRAKDRVLTLPERDRWDWQNIF